MRLPFPVATGFTDTTARYPGRRLLFVSSNSNQRHACASLLEATAVHHASCDSLQHPLVSPGKAGHASWDAIIVDHALFDRDPEGSTRQLAALRDTHSCQLLLLAYPNQRPRTVTAALPLLWVDKPLRTRPLYQALERMFAPAGDTRT